MAEQNYTINIIVNGKDNASGVLGGVTSSLQRVGEFALGGVLTAGITGGISAIGQLGASAISAGFDFNSLKEQAGIAFTTMLGDATKAQTVMDDLQAFAASTPFEFPELLGASKKLLAFNVEAKDLIPTLTSLGDLSAGVGVPVSDLADIYGKAKVQGRLFAEDVNQLTGRGIPVIQEFAKQFGVSDSEVRKLVEDGKIGFPQLEKAFQSLTGEGGKFGGLMEKQSKSFGGLVSTLKDTAVQAAGVITKPIFEVATGALAGVVNFASSDVVQGALTNAAAGIGEFVRGGIASVQQLLSAAQPLAQNFLTGFSAIQSVLMTTIVPALMQLAGFVVPLVRNALGQFAAFGQTVLLPALMQVGVWFTGTFLPALGQVAGYISQNILPIIANLATFLVTTILPAFLQFAAFLITTVAPIVLQFAGGALNFLGGALAQIGGFINDHIVPALIIFAGWLQQNLPKAISAGVSFFNTVLLPALQTVWAFLANVLVPILQKLWGTLAEQLMSAARGLGLAFNVLGEFMQGVWRIINTYVIPALTNVANFITGTIQGVIETFSGIVQGLAAGFEGVWKFGALVLDILGQIADAIKNIDLTPILPLIGQSPAPLAIGLASINEELRANLPLMQQLRREATGISLGGGLAFGYAGAGGAYAPAPYPTTASKTVNVTIEGNVLLDQTNRIEELIDAIFARLRQQEQNEAEA